MNPRWQKRMAALEAQLNATANELSSTTNPINHCLLALTKSLQVFGKDQFTFFEDGFSRGQLLPAMMLPPEHILRVTLDQISFDLTLIRQIYDQRQQKELQGSLAKADNLAQAALNLSIKADLLPQTAVLTYLNKSPNIRILPYAPIALIGLPYTATEVNLDYLAIPHEVGHFVYHHAPGLAAQLHKLIPLYPDWINHWLEEIFADVYAAIVAGPIAGYTLQAMLQDNAQEKFVANDGEHPPDAIRPFGYTKVLHALNFPKAAVALNNAWQALLHQRHQPMQFNFADRTTAIDLTKAQKMIEETAVTFLNYLQKEHKLSQPAPWSKDGADLNKMQQAFNHWLNKLLPIDHYLLKLAEGEIGVVTNGGKPINRRKIGTTQTWRDWFKAEARRDPNQRIPAQAWEPIFTAGHWPVKGPEGNSDGGV
ncbi:MAG: hypothetical protein DHS20C20_10140 [Ardenticatenaceae bacterium]|nr:MAG: hypothetical protein DHS20C20_10140 [Ardenticatenaceae bacterium]